MLTWLVDHTVPFILTVELLFGSTMVIAAVITHMVVIVVVLAVWLAVVLATRGQVGEKYIRWQLVQVAISDKTKLVNNLTTLPTRDSVGFSLPVDAFEMKFSGYETKWVY